MAKIRLKLGDSEIEVDSRDFYVDNDTLHEIIDGVSNILKKHQPKITHNSGQLTQTAQVHQYGLESLNDAEVFEPEFSDPTPISFGEIKSKLRILETNGFFNSPRTACETAEQLREHGWAADKFDVAMSLVKMASNRELCTHSNKNRTHYCVQQALVSN